MKIKNFECPESIRNYEKKNLGMSDAWWTSHLSHRPSEPVYYIVDCWISKCPLALFTTKLVLVFLQQFPNGIFNSGSLCAPIAQLSIKPINSSMGSN